MPKEYTSCVKGYTAKGVPLKEAKARCAAAYYKRHKITVKEAHKKGVASFDKDFLDYDEDIMNAILKVDSLQATKKPSKKKIDVHFNIVKYDDMCFGSQVERVDNIVTVCSTQSGATARIIGFHNDGIVVEWNKDILSKIAGSWIGGTVGRNHETRDEGKILWSRFDEEEEKLYQTVSITDKLKNDINAHLPNVGVSIEADKVLYIDDRDDENYLNVTEAEGTGLTFVFEPKKPHCPPEHGCEIFASDIVGDETMTDEDNKKPPIPPCPKEQEEAKKLEATQKAEIEELKEQVENLNKEKEELSAFKEEIDKEKKHKMIVEIQAAKILEEDEIKELEEKPLAEVQVFATIVEKVKKKLEDEKVEGSGAEGTQSQEEEKGKEELSDEEFDKIKEREKELTE